MHAFVANFLGYATTKNYWNWIIFSQVFTKVKRVTFFEIQCMLHNTAQKSSDNLSSYPPDNHHSSDVVCGGEGNLCFQTLKQQCQSTGNILQAFNIKQYANVTVSCGWLDQVSAECFLWMNSTSQSSCNCDRESNLHHTHQTAVTAGDCRNVNPFTADPVNALHSTILV